MGFNIDDLRKNPNAVVQIIPKGRNVSSVTGLLQSDLTFALTNTYSSPFEMGNMQQQLSDTVSQVITGANTFLGTDIQQATLQTLANTMNIYKNSERPTFQISMLLISIRSSENIMTDVKNIMRMSLPTYSDTTKLISPPLGFLPKLDSVSGTVDIRFGNWFWAPDQLINSATFTFSKEMLPNNSPLWAKVDIAFQPWLMPVLGHKYNLIDWFIAL